MNDLSPKPPIWKRWWFWCITVVFIIVASRSGQNGTGKSVPRVEEASQPAQTQPARPVLYEIVKVKDLSLKALSKPLSSYSLNELNNLPMNVRKTYQVLVPEDIRQEQIRPTVEKIISMITSENNDIDEIILNLCSDREIATLYDVAKVTWAPNGEWGSTTPEIARTNDRISYKMVFEIRPDLEEYLIQRNQTESKYGLKNEERKRFFKELIASEDKAMLEADRIYPLDSKQPGWREDNLNKNIQMYRNLRDKYRAQLAQKYGLSENQMSDISVEGIKKNWSME